MYIIRRRRRLVLADELIDDGSGLVELLERLLEHRLFPEHFQESLALAQLVVLLHAPVE